MTQSQSYGHCTAPTVVQLTIDCRNASAHTHIPPISPSHTFHLPTMSQQALGFINTVCTELWKAMGPYRVVGIWWGREWLSGTNWEWREACKELLGEGKDCRDLGAEGNACKTQRERERISGDPKGRKQSVRCFECVREDCGPGPVLGLPSEASCALIDNPHTFV